MKCNTMQRSGFYIHWFPYIDSMKSVIAFASCPKTSKIHKSHPDKPSHWHMCRLIWLTVCNASPTSNQQWFNDSHLLRWSENEVITPWQLNRPLPSPPFYLAPWHPRKHKWCFKSVRALCRDPGLVLRCRCLSFGIFIPLICRLRGIPVPGSPCQDWEDARPAGITHPVITRCWTNVGLT